MQVLDEHAVAEWWARVPELHAGHGLQPPALLASLRVDASFEAKQQAAYAVARAIAGWLLASREPVLASVFEHGIWPSSENLHLYYTWRRALGHGDLLEAAPGHVFESHELEDCTTLIQLSLLFGWGISCGAPGLGRAFHIDHDGHGLLAGRGDREFAELVPAYLKAR